MERCSCYHQHGSKFLCYGTKEMEECSCGGDVRKCNFYPEKRKQKTMTNADRIRSMSDEELAEFLVSKTVYQESAWSEPSYLNFLTGKDDAKSNAIADTIKWLQQMED